jgi:hypothetical protein
MDESQKQRVMVAIIAFNLTIITFQVALNMGQSFTLIKLLGGIVLAAVVAAGAYFGAQFMQK